MVVTARRMRISVATRPLVVLALLWDLGVIVIPDLLVPLYFLVAAVGVWLAAEHLIDPHARALYNSGARRPLHATALALGALISGFKFLVSYGVLTLLDR